MKKLFTSVLVVIIFILIGGFWLAKNNSITNNSFKHYKNSVPHISFDYPSSWNIKTIKEENGTAQLSITAPDFSENSISKKLSLTVIQVKQNQAYSVILPECQDNQKAGTLTINKKVYTRCDTGSGLHMYRLGFQESDKEGNQLFFDISYNSTDPYNQDTKTIENIIQSILF